VAHPPRGKPPPLGTTNPQIRFPKQKSAADQGLKRLKRARHCIQTQLRGSINPRTHDDSDDMLAEDAPSHPDRSAPEGGEKRKKKDKRKGRRSKSRKGKAWNGS